MRTATTLVQIHYHPQVPENGMRAATTQAQIRQTQPQVPVNRTRAAKQQAQIRHPPHREPMLVSWRPSIGVRLEKGPPDVIDLEEQSGSEQGSIGIGSTPFVLLDIPFHQPPRRGNEDDETIPGILDVIDEAEITTERRTTSLPPSRVAKVLSPKPITDDVAQRLDLTQLDRERDQLRGSSSLGLPSGRH